MALRHDEYLKAGAVVAAIDIDSPGQHAAMVDKLRLPFPMLSDPDRTRSIEPYDLVNTEDPRGLAVSATVVIDPNGDEVLRLVSRDYADRPFEDVALDALRGLGLAPADQPVPRVGDPAPGPGAMPFGDLRAYFRGAKFASKAMGLRTGATEEADRFAALMDHYVEDAAAMYRIIRDSR